jgi:2-iminobutanoate/2-iminopropanoate deaminase
VGESFEEQAIRTLDNLRTIAEAAGARLTDFVKVNVYLNDLGNIAKFNEIYQRYFSEPYPARTTVHSALVGMMIEVDGIAVLPD